MTPSDLLDSEQAAARRILAQTAAARTSTGTLGAESLAPIRRMLWRARHRYIRLRQLRLAILSRLKP